MPVEGGLHKMDTPDNGLYKVVCRGMISNQWADNSLYHTHAEPILVRLRDYNHNADILLYPDVESDNKLQVYNDVYEILGGCENSFKGFIDVDVYMEVNKNPDDKHLIDFLSNAYKFICHVEEVE